MARFTDFMVDLIIGKGLIERRECWRKEKERERVRRAQLHSGTPITLHAATYKRSLEHFTQSSVSSTNSSNSGPQILMPNQHFLNVHSHYAKVPVHVASAIIQVSEVFQCFDYRRSDSLHQIGFQEPEYCFQASPPARKVTNLERLPPLNAEVAAEISQHNRKLKQAEAYHRIKEQQQRQDEQRRRAETARKYPMTQFIPNLGIHRRGKAVAVVTLPEPKVKPSTTSTDTADGQARIKPSDSEAITEVGTSAKQKRIRWASNVDVNLRQQKQQHTNANGAPPSPPIPIPRAKASTNLNQLAYAA